jgi:hypothetical protein
MSEYLSLNLWSLSKDKLHKIYMHCNITYTKKNKKDLIDILVKHPNYLKMLQVDCSICFESIEKCNNISLKCSHTFHFNCLERWFEKSTTCPLCRDKSDVEFKKNRLEYPITIGTRVDAFRPQTNLWYVSTIKDIINEVYEIHYEGFSNFSNEQLLNIPIFITPMGTMTGKKFFVGMELDVSIRDAWEYSIITGICSNGMIHLDNTMWINSNDAEFQFY